MDPDWMEWEWWPYSEERREVERAGLREELLRGWASLFFSSAFFISCWLSGFRLP